MGIKLLLTGEPKSGKSTILKEAVVSDINSAGYITEEVLSKGIRKGFITKSSDGNRAIIASDSIVTPYKVGRDFVQVQYMDIFFSKKLDFSTADLLYFDEVGQMQLMSSKFKEVVEEFKSSGLPLLLNVSKIYSSPIIDDLINDEEAILLSLSVENRSEISKIVKAYVSSCKYLSRLNAKQIKFVAKLGRENINLTSQYKLFNNSIPYVSENKITKKTLDTFIVEGNTNSHVVTKTNNSLNCDCDFFNGLNQYHNNSGSCSHIFAVRIFLLK